MYASELFKLPKLFPPYNSNCIGTPEIDTPDSFTVEKQNFNLKVHITGHEFPQDVYINYNHQLKKMNRTSQSTHNYIFNNVKEAPKSFAADINCSSLRLLTHDI